MPPTPKDLKIERILDSLATISDIIFKRLKCMECNQCEPCGPIFMGALKNLRAVGKVNRGRGLHK
jgi:hypothetical protein